MIIIGSRSELFAKTCTDLMIPEAKSKLAPRPLWRKREVVRQERTVQYTTVDADGELQVFQLS
jgi:hypothetical protein